jgi:hypothetical protein
LLDKPSYDQATACALASVSALQAAVDRATCFAEVNTRLAACQHLAIDAPTLQAYKEGDPDLEALAQRYPN